MENYIKQKFKNVDYLCYGEEIGDSSEGKKHMHFYFELKNALSKASIIKKFPGANVDIRKGTPTEARNYVLKPEGYLFGKDKIEKSHTRYREFKEWGNWINYKNIERVGKEEPLTLNDKYTVYINDYNSIEEVQAVDIWFAKMFKQELTESFKNKAKQELIKKIGTVKIVGNGKAVTFLNKKIYYLQGDSKIGKTAGIKFKYGEENVCSIHCGSKNPFGKYKGQAVLNLDEFRSQFTITEMLTMLDSYGSELSALYNNLELLADTVILSSNQELEQQYSNVQTANPKDWQAFKNRFVNGIWEMLYDSEIDRKYIFCLSDETEYSGYAVKLVDFSDPPIYCDGEESIHITEYSVYLIIKELIKKRIPTTEENINKELAKLPY